MKTINEVIGGWLLEGGNTKQALADHLGISTVTLNNKLNGETEWSWTQVRAICKLTSTKLSDIGPEEGKED